MNRKGFTLIELLAVIILIALIAVLIVPNIIDTMTKSKEASYQLLVKNIVTASKSYYEECEYGDLSNKEKYGEEYACEIKIEKNDDNNNYYYIELTLSDLANTGFLSVKDVDKKTNEKLVLNPKAVKEDEKNISDCEIKITKKIDKNYYKVTYTITSASQDKKKCPSTKDYATTEVNSSEESESVE